MNRSIETRTYTEIPFSRPSIGDEEIAAAAAVLRSGWLTTGPEALAFEEEFADRVGARFALAVNSATAGLHLSLEALGVGAGDFVIVPSLTFTATAEVARYLGAEIRFADIDPETLLIDPADIDARAREIVGNGGRVAAIIPVHLAGAVCAMEEIRAVADRWNAVVVEDAAHAFPAHRDGRTAGTFGRTGVFSFYANKTITTGEGGMVCTDEQEIADRIRVMRLHGIDREAWRRYRDLANSSYYEVVAPGYKYNMPDLAAAIGRVQLRRADEFLDRRRALALRYRKALDGHGGIAIAGRSDEGHAHHLCIAILPESRDELVTRLRERGIGTSVHYHPLHRMPYWKERYQIGDEALPGTASIADRIISLPLFPDLTDDEQERVIATVREYYG